MSNYMIKLKFELENSSPFWSGKNDEIKIENEKNIVIFGSSIFGAIKSSLNFEKSAELKNCIEGIFGSINKKKDFQESKVFISDMKGKVKTINRAGIRINNETGSTKKSGLYETVLIPKGNKFEFRVEVKEVCSYGKAIFEESLKEIIENIQNCKIMFGSNKTKGFGKFKIEKILRKDFDLHKIEDLREYLDWEEKSENYKEEKVIEVEKKIDISFKGKIKDSFLLKGESIKEGIKTVQHSYKEDSYIIPSGTIKGSMRAYIEKILNTLHGENEYSVISELFGHNPDPKINNGNYKMGKLIVEDCVLDIKDTDIVEYHRIKIDRFTGGAINGALINEKRLVNGEVNLKFRVNRTLEDKEKALILLYLRDLGLGKITLGSNGSVGSGRIEGSKANINGIEISFEKENEEIKPTSIHEKDINNLFKSLNGGDN